MSGKGARAAALAAALCLAAARAGATSSGASLLADEIGPRAAGLGGAYTALAEGSDALWWNPAGLAGTPRPEAGFVQSRWLEDFSLYGLQAAAPLSPSLGLGFGVLYADYGSINLVDNTGATQFGSYSASDIAAVGGAAKSWDDGRWSLGVSGKVIEERIESASARGEALDAGGRWRDGDWTAAAVLQNVGPGIKFLDGSSPMPTTLRTGGAWSPDFLPGATFALDMVRPKDLGTSWRVGGEYLTPAVWGLRAALRLGFSTLAGAFDGLAYGFGVRSRSWTFDFAVQSSESRPASWIGMTGRFGGAAAAPPPAAANRTAPSSSEAAPADRRPPAQVLADALAWYRRKVAEGVLNPQEREDVLRRLLSEFEPQGVDVGAIRKELDVVLAGQR